MLPVEEALAAVLSAAAARAAVSAVPLLDALGLVLAEDARAPDPLPPFRASVKVCLPICRSTTPPPPPPAPPPRPALR
jgi:gephyrin